MRQVLVDASAFITLAEIGRERSVEGVRGEVLIPTAVVREITDDPAATELRAALEDGWLRADEAENVSDRALDAAATHLGESERERDHEGTNWSGDVALLARAVERDEVVIVTDDKPLRKTCKALGIDVSGSIGVLIAAVERGELRPEDAKEALVAMDEVGARLSARLLRRAERLIDEASED